MPKSKIDILLRYKCVLMHFAGFIKMVGNKDINSLKYLDRLNRVVKNTDSAVACSTVTQSGTYEQDNYTGKFGGVIKLKSEGSILYCSSGDAGTTPEYKEGRKDNMKNSDSNFENAIFNRVANEYNKISVCEYEIMGVFLIVRYNMLTKMVVIYL